MENINKTNGRSVHGPRTHIEVFDCPYAGAVQLCTKENVQRENDFAFFKNDFLNKYMKYLEALQSFPSFIT